LWQYLSHGADSDAQEWPHDLYNEYPVSSRAEIASVSPEDRLDSWKEISAYLKRSVRTVRRWEVQEKLPVHRHGHRKGGSVYAYKTELDAWWQSRQVQNAHPEFPANESPQRLVESLTGVRNSTAPRDVIPLPAIALASPSRMPFWMWLLAGVAGGLAAMYGLQHMPSREAGSLTVTPLTTLPGKEVHPSLSPDGNQVAFAFNGGRSSNYDIYIKTLGSEEITRLTSDPADDLSPSWSPDGQNIVFLRFVSDQSALVMVTSSTGGKERQLAQLQIERVETEIRVAWSPDGEWIATSDKETQQSPLSLVLISSTTGRKRRLVYMPRSMASDVSPSFSPDGRYLAYSRHISIAVGDIYLLEIPKEGGPATEARPLTRWNRMNKSPVWSGDGKEVFFVGDEPRIGSRIWRVAAFARGEARRISQIGEGGTSITLSARGNRLVYSKEIEDWNIWRLDLAPASRAGGQNQFSSSRVIASTYEDSQPQYSPDGKYIAFQSDRSGDFEIWIANSDGSSPRQLTRLHAKVSGYPRWSPDGKYIVFHSRPSGYANLYMINVETGSYRAITTGMTNDTVPTWSHDGKWIYFLSERNDGSQIWRIPAEGGSPSQLTKNGGAAAFDSVDGKLLFYSKFSEQGLWMLPLKGGNESQLLRSLYGIDTFAITKAGIYFACRTSDNDAAIDFMSFSPRPILQIARINSPLGSGLAVSPDGRSLLYVQADQIGSDLILVDNLN
jgi:Tol biopolymer transport system component